MKKTALILVIFALLSCKKQEITMIEFKTEALLQELISTDGNKVSFGEVLERYKGKPILIDVWASWCPDCIKGMPKVHKLQEEYQMVYVFLSYDKNENDWKTGIEKYRTQGENYLIQSDWKSGKFRETLDIDWIPRYIVVGQNGEILLYNAIEADDPKLLEIVKPFKK